MAPIVSRTDRHIVLKDGVEVAALYDLPWHGQVCLHSDDPELTARLVEAGVVSSARAPFLDDTGRGIHGAYVPRVQLKLVEMIVSPLVSSESRIDNVSLPASSPAGETITWPATESIEAGARFSI